MGRHGERAETRMVDALATGAGCLLAGWWRKCELRGWHKGTLKNDVQRTRTSLAPTAKTRKEEAVADRKSCR